MSINNPSDETERKIIQILARSFKPKPIQEIADDIQRSYDDTLKYLVSIGENRPIRFTNITDVPGGLQAVETVVGSDKKRGIENVSADDGDGFMSFEGYTDEEMNRWLWLRAVEWGGLPAYLSQPIARVLFDTARNKENRGDGFLYKQANRPSQRLEPEPTVHLMWSSPQTD